MPCIYPVILSGGVGSRLWPLSRSLSPKQMLPLIGRNSLIQETALRTVGPHFTKPLVICHATHQFLVKEQMRAIGIQPHSVILEPVGRNTAPAAAVAALKIAEEEPDAVLLLMPADHLIRDSEALHTAIDTAEVLAKRGHLVTFGIYPTGAETGYGYIQRGRALAENAFAVARFVEKPDAMTAQHYVAAGDYYWNSGMFVFQAATYLAELERLEPSIVAQCRGALRHGRRDSDCFLLDTEWFEACKPVSIDYAVMEHTDKAAVVPVEMGWSDVGSWAALWDAAPKDPDGNVIVGSVLHHGARNSYLRSEGPLIAALDIEDLVVVAGTDAILVGPKSAAQDVKRIVERLERDGNELRTTHRKLRHPWGWSERISQGENFLVNRITLNVGATRDIPPIQARSGHWLVACGSATITSDEEVVHRVDNESYRLTGTGVRLENAGTAPLHIIEVLMVPS